ncbi:hypothetical protein R3W88_017064 [Solanum pinnatisectum]|uniref:RNase H type-1 domain-containing protein n=1 Tax=Solanum pinnatisectum TaxID=50273 RepID=A0AAV9KZH1_9SOLN|nr:hypothetical protein R3W88_017064 [Solanum pinnatisectum]
MEDIHNTLGKITVNVRHIFREANQLADCIANSAVNTEDKQIFLNFQQLPSKGRKFLNIDKYQVPSVRIKTRKINSYNNGLLSQQKEIHGSAKDESKRAKSEVVECIQQRDMVIKAREHLLLFGFNCSKKKSGEEYQRTKMRNKFNT